MRRRAFTILTRLSLGALVLFPLSLEANTLIAKQGPFLIYTEQSTTWVSSQTKVRAAELLLFLESDVLPKLPTTAKTTLQDYRFAIYLTEKPKISGVFFSPTTSGEHLLSIKIDQALLSSENIFQLVTHEFFHAVHFALKPGEPAWVREGLAQVFEYLVLDYFNGINLDAALKIPTTPLMGEYDLRHIVPAQYGHDLLYFYYLYRHCGREKFFWKLVLENPTTLAEAGIELALRQSKIDKEQCSCFESSATNFEIARILNHVSYAESAPNERHYLLPTSIRFETPMPAPEKDALGTLRRFEPIVVSANYDAGKAASHLQRVWIKTRFPYDVQSTPPTGTNPNWLQILFLK